MIVVKRREVIEMVKTYGLELVSLSRVNHWKARVRRRDGTERMVTFPTSTSDYRALKNKGAQLRNIASGAE